MALVVKKFGGTSVGSIERMHHVARVIKEYRELTGDEVVVVVSAMAGETNRLTELARQCVSSPEPRELDVLLATGEQASAALLSMALSDCGVRAKSYTALQLNIATDRAYNRARIQAIHSDRLREALSSGCVPVVTGFQGMNTDGDLTTLGRGGSDISAVALAAALQAEACHIYTDVDGVFSCDPRWCPGAKLLKQVCHEEMLEMASLGARVLHPRSVYFAMLYDVPLAVLSSLKAPFTPQEMREVTGTWVVREELLMEKPVVRGITYRTDDAKVTVSKIPRAKDAFSVLFREMAVHDIFIDMITQTGYDAETTDISFTVLDEISAHAMRISRDLVPELGAQAAVCERDIAKVSAVGIGMRYNAGVAATMFDALASVGVPVQMISTSEIKISVIIPREFCETAVQTLHEAFIEMVGDAAVEVGVEG